MISSACVWARGLSLVFGIGIALSSACGGSTPPADEERFKKSEETQDWPPPSLGMPAGGAHAPAPAAAGGPPAGPAGPAGPEGPAPAGGPPPGPGGPGAPAGPAAPIADGPLAGCNPAQQGELLLFDCAWGVALFGPGAAKGASKAARDKAIEGFVGTVLQGSQMQVEASKPAKMTIGGKSLKGRHVAVKNPQPPHAMVAEGTALFVSDAADAKIMACLKAKEDQEKDRCQKVFEGFLKEAQP
jgi:hypothetical protein